MGERGREGGGDGAVWVVARGGGGAPQSRLGFRGLGDFSPPEGVTKGSWWGGGGAASATDGQ
jgi:hypothetical protein